MRTCHTFASSALITGSANHSTNGRFWSILDVRSTKNNSLRTTLGRANCAVSAKCDGTQSVGQQAEHKTVSDKLPITSKKALLCRSHPRSTKHTVLFPRLPRQHYFPCAERFWLWRTCCSRMFQCCEPWCDRRAADSRKWVSSFGRYCFACALYAVHGLRNDCLHFGYLNGLYCA